MSSGRPDEIVTANIGCLMHLQAGLKTRVRHWIELVDECLAAGEEGTPAAAPR